MIRNQLEEGDFIQVKGVDFKNGAKSFQVVAATEDGGEIVIWLDDKNGTSIGTCKIENTGGWEKWKTFSTTVDKATGVHDVFFVFKGNGKELFNLDFWNFNQ